MKINKIYKSLLDKSLGSMLSAIEIYNKPNFMYREEIFSILSVNAWELLLKAHILKLHKYNLRSIYELKPSKKKDGSMHKTKKDVLLNRCGNPKTKSINNILAELGSKGKLNSNLIQNLEALIELRDNSIHFVNIAPLIKPVQELGFACIKNYMAIIKEWKLDIDLSSYNFYLMPLAYIDDKIVVDTAITPETEKFVKLIKEKISSEKDNIDYSIAISIDIDFKKGNSFNAIGVSFDPNGIPIALSEENFKKKYPFTFKEVVAKCRSRYINFKQNNIFYEILKEIQGNVKLSRLRQLNPENPKSPQQYWYNSNIFNVFDKRYSKI